MPLTREVVWDWLDEALPAQGGAALDAGCGRQSQLKPFRKRIARFIGVDIHEPSRNLRWLDEFVIADVCRDTSAFPEGSFDVALSSFTVEHFQDPEGAFATLASWLRPGGWLVITTVNRRHPFVDAYLSLPDGVRSQIQPIVKASEADAHPLVGACNTPAALRDALTAAGIRRRRGRDDRIPVARMGPLPSGLRAGSARRRGRAAIPRPPLDDRRASASIGRTSRLTDPLIGPPALVFSEPAALHRR